jgi:hypothetical protein
MSVEHLILSSTGSEWDCVGSSEETLWPESLDSVDIGHFLEWDWAGIVEMLEEFAWGRDLSDLYDNIDVVVLSTRDVETSFRIPG